MARHRRKRKLSKKEKKALAKTEARASADVQEQPKQREQISVSLPETITIADLSKKSGRSAAEIVGALLTNGVIATVNDSVDRETIEIIADELDLTVAAQQTATETVDHDDADTATRPPVVVVLGHVDHGKTTLLDSIRQADVVASESGGITQHIGAYQVQWNTEDGSRRPITFIDTPGHEAFSAMRAHGVTMTDIAILVVAADDGVKPQTKEAVSHARAAGVPIIVAINKIDAPGAQVDKVKGELAELDLAAEDWGGKTPTVSVSAKEKTGIDELLDTVLLVADVEDIQARHSGNGQGVVIEAHMEQGIGPVATVLVQHGQLAVGDPVAVGSVAGKVRRMEDEHGSQHKTVGPATPVRIAGLSAVPTFGATLQVMDSDKAAKALAQTHDVSSKSATVSLAQHDETDTTKLSVVLKADVDGSLNAIQSSLEALEVGGIDVQVVHQAVGDLSESDVNLALAARHPFLAAFRTGATVAARNLARSKQLDIRAYDVIYRLIEDVTAAAKKLRQVEFISVESGRLKVLEVFHTTKTAQIVGGRVEQGRIVKGGTLEIQREGVVVGTGVTESLQRGQKKADEVPEGEECGLGVSTTETIKQGDVLVVSTTEEASE